MGKSLEQQLAQSERADARYQKRIEAILWKEGHVAADRQRAGFEVSRSTALTSVHFKDPGRLHGSQVRLANLKQYQAALKRHNIELAFCEEDPEAPYLRG